MSDLKGRINRIERFLRPRPSGRLVVVAAADVADGEEPGAIRLEARGHCSPDGWERPCWFMHVPPALGGDRDPVDALTEEQRAFLEPDDRLAIVGHFDLGGGGLLAVETEPRPWAEILAERGEDWR
jgi:hypothetical protein